MNKANVIKVCAVLTAIPRWTGALMVAEGVPIPTEWLGWWRVLAAVLSVGMAVTEAFAISYILSAWRNQHDKSSRNLPILALVALMVFTLVLAPYIAANVRVISLADVLGGDWLWWLWSISVAASTGIIVGGVGYAEKMQDGATSRNQNATARNFNESAQKEMKVAKKKKVAYSNFVAMQSARNGNGPMNANEIAEQFGVSVRTGYNWLEKYDSEHQK